MSETAAQKPVTPEELAELIAEFEEYRDRLRNDTLEAAKRAKLPKSTVMAKLEPELQKLDATIEGLRAQQALLVADN